MISALAAALMSVPHAVDGQVETSQQTPSLPNIDSLRQLITSYAKHMPRGQEGVAVGCKFSMSSMPKLLPSFVPELGLSLSGL